MLNIPTIPEGATTQGAAIIYAGAGMEVFPVVPKGKSPIRDEDLGFTSGWQTATIDKKILAKVFHKFPNAGIGWKIPSDIVIIDCDVQKDENKVPALDREGMPKQTGISVLQNLIDEHGEVSEMATHRNRTQSGGIQYFYYLTDKEMRQMREKNLAIKNRRAFDHVDIKTGGGYTILPPSEGRYGKYQHLGNSEIKPLPYWLFRLITTDTKRGVVMDTNDDDEKIGASNMQAIFKHLLPYWERADGRRNDLAMAIDGSLAIVGIPMDQRYTLFEAFCKATGKGCDHTQAPKYTNGRMNAGKTVFGSRKLGIIMDEIGGAMDE